MRSRTIISYVIAASVMLGLCLVPVTANTNAEPDAVHLKYNDLLIPELVDSMGISKQEEYWFRNAMYHNLLGVQLFYEKQYAFALKHFTIANNMAPNNATVLIRIAATYEKLDVKAKASEFYQKARDLYEAEKG